MKRDMDLVRKMLFKMEQNPHGFNNKKLEIEGYSGEEIGYHAALMHEAGLIKGIDFTHLQSESPDYRPHCLTWSGHDFLDACRNEGRWTQAKEIFSQLDGVTFDVAKQVLVSLMTTAATQLIRGASA